MLSTIKPIRNNGIMKIALIKENGRFMAHLYLIPDKIL